MARPTAPPRPPRGRLGSLRFQSKLLVIMLIVSVSSALVAGLIGYTFGTTALRDTEYQRLTQLRESRKREIDAFYAGISEAATVLTHSSATVDAVSDFRKAFADLQDTPLPPGADKAVRNYYNTVFGPELSERTGTKVDPELYLPTSNAQTYLQDAYTVPANGDWDAAITLQASGDSEWSEFNAKYQPFFADFTERFGFEDTLLIGPDGNVVYSAYKTIDLGANILAAPYTTTKLAEAYRKAMRATSVDEVIFTDFERYAPAFNVPTPWVVTPIGDEKGIRGVLALQLSLEAINDVMTGNRQWEQDGLGKTGETFLAGPDRLMRSVSRELLQNPEQYYKDVVANGTPADVAERQLQVGGSILLQPVNVASVNAALSGGSGLVTAKSYLGPEALNAYERLDIPGLNWAIVAKINRSEALAPVAAFARNIALSTAAIVLAVCLLAVLFSRMLTRPVTTLAAAVRRVSGGELGVSVRGELQGRVWRTGLGVQRYEHQPADQTATHRRTDQGERQTAGQSDARIGGSPLPGRRSQHQHPAPQRLGGLRPAAGVRRVLPFTAARAVGVDAQRAGRGVRRCRRTARCGADAHHAGQRSADHLRPGGTPGRPCQPQHRVRQGSDRDRPALQRPQRRPAGDPGGNRQRCRHQRSGGGTVDYLRALGRGGRLGSSGPFGHHVRRDIRQ